MSIVIQSNQITSVHIDCSSRSLKLQQVAACSQVLLDESTPSCPSSQKTEKKDNQKKIFVFGKHVNILIAGYLLIYLFMFDIFQL